MSQPGESDREVFSHSMNTIAQFQSAVVVLGLVPSKGVGCMTLMAQMDCCTVLGIGPKTLRNWLRHAKMQFSTSPTDARLKCLTWEQVQQLATLHARSLQMSPDSSPAPGDEVTPLASPAEHTAAASE